MAATTLTSRFKDLAILAFAGGLAFTGLSTAPELGATPAHADTISGSTGGFGDDTGSGSIGSGGPGGTPVNIGGLDSVASVEARGVERYKFYNSGNDVSGCEAAGSPTAKYVWRERTIQNGRYVYVNGATGCDYARQYVREIYKHYCVVNSEVEFTQNRPEFKVLLRKDQKTVWGKGTHTIEACDQSRSSNASGSVKVGAHGQYRAKGETNVDALYVTRYLNADLFTGRIPPTEVYRVEHAKTVNVFDKKYTFNCGSKNLWNDWRQYEGLDCDNDGTPTKPPVPGIDTSSSTTNPVYQCVVDGKASLDGKTDDIVDIMRDGKAHNLAWPGLTVKGTGIKNVVGKSTYYEIWNAPQLDGPFNGGNTLSLKVGTKELIPQSRLFKQDPKGLSVTDKVNGIQTRATLRAYKSSARDEPVMVVPVWDIEADMTVDAVEATLDPMTGEVTTMKSTVVKRQVGTCRGPAVTSNVLKILNDVM